MVRVKLDRVIRQSEGMEEQGNLFGLRLIDVVSGLFEVVNRFKPGKGNVVDQTMGHTMVLIDVSYRLKEGVTTHAAAVTFAVDDDPDMLSSDGDIHVKLGIIPCPTLSRVKLLYTFHVLLRIATFLKAAG